MSKRPDAPNIAGQNPFYMDLQLKNYRSGERRNPVMNVVADGLSDEEIANLVAYYAAIKRELGGATAGGEGPGPRPQVVYLETSKVAGRALGTHIISPV